ncbi:MAG: PBECR2 nuclease fold domain-containing protein [Chryseobacterium sp.]
MNTAVAYLDAQEQEERYPFSCLCGKHTVAVSEPLKTALTLLTKKMVKAIFNKEDIEGVFGEFVVTEALYLVSGLRENFDTFSPYIGQDQLTLQMMEYNLFDFSASKTESRLASMMDLLVNEKGALRSFSDFEAECLKKTEDLNKKYLETEYNLSIAVGQNSAQYVRFLEEKDTVTSFVQYQTVGDDKVRPQHQVLDGKIFSLDDKEAMQLWPPNGYGCRCEFLQYVESTKGNVTTGLRGKELMYNKDPKYKNSQFEINRGDLKQVFTKKQFYSDNKGLPEKMSNMTFDKYNLKKWADFKEDLKPLKIDKTINSENAKELFKKAKGGDYMGFEDYYGRKMTLSQGTFNKHTKGHYLSENEKRHQFFPHLQDIVKNPSEVWYYEKKENSQSFKSRYVKFYNDTAIVVECDMDNKQGLEILTWYPLKGDEKQIRHGFKIK